MNRLFTRARCWAALSLLETDGGMTTVDLRPDGFSSLVSNLFLSPFNPKD